MGRPKSKGAYAPLAAQYFMDDAILEAGPEAELLFVRCLSFCASVPSDGFITEKQMRTIVGLGLRNVSRRVDALLEVGLLRNEDGGFVIRSWSKWNKSAQEIGRLLARDRERKARKSTEVPLFSDGIPDGTDTDSALQSSTEQSSTEQNSPTGSSARSAARGTRIPEPFMVTADMRVWAAERTPLVNVDRSTERFVNHWRAKTGRDATKKDWLATWRNWLLKDQEDAEARGVPQMPKERALSVLELGRRRQAELDLEKAVGR